MQGARSLSVAVWLERAETTSSEALTVPAKRWKPCEYAKQVDPDGRRVVLLRSSNCAE